MSYILLYCLYDPDNYVGYHKHTFVAKDSQDAERIGVEYLSHKIVRPIEYQIIEIGNIIVGPKLLES